MGVYYGTTEITNVDWIPGDKDITQAFFGSTEVFTVWAEYDGTLPAQYSANGDYLVDYRIYGSAGGVGDRTVNLINPADMTPKCYININGYISPSNYWKIYYVPVRAGETYTCSSLSIVSSNAYIGYCDSQKRVIGVVGNAISTKAQTVTAPTNAAYLAISNYDVANRPMLVHGSTAPAEYVPPGYEVDMSVSTANLLDCESGWQARLGGGTATGDNVTGNLTISAQYWFQKIIKAKPNTTYTLHGTSSSHTVTVGYGAAGAQNGALADPIFTVYSSNITRSFNTGAWDQIAIILFCGTSSAGETTYNELQLEEKDSFSGFIPYYSTTTPIYIGDTPLGEDEYVDYGSGKIYRMIDSTLTPTDPPVPLPVLPTVDGVNIVDYAGQSAAVPSRFVAKYRKEGF